MTKDDIGGTRGSEMEGDEVDGEGEYIGEHSPEYRKNGVIGAGRGVRSDKASNDMGRTQTG